MADASSPRSRAGRRSQPYPITAYDLEVLIGAARATGVNDAAVQLGISRQAVIRRLRKLEHRVGLDLFEDLPETVALTPTGRSMLPLAVTAHGELEALEAFAAQARAQRGASGPRR